jgi:beta-phosphoglucomutase
MPEFQAILFDFDGVLADTEPVHWASWAEALAPLGITLEWEFYRDYCIGMNDRDMTKMMAARFRPARNWEELWARYVNKKESFRARSRATPPFDSNLAPFLERLHKDYRLAVVTSSSCLEIEPLLIAGGLRPYFDTLVGGESVLNHKPAPDPYLLAAERLSARAVLVVEDSEPGIASGRAAGFEVLEVKHPIDVPELVLRRLSGGTAAA